LLDRADSHTKCNTRSPKGVSGDTDRDLIRQEGLQP
jgi:hypothetical protein